MNISIAPELISMKLLPVVDSTQIEGTVSQIFDIGPSFFCL